MPRGPSTLPEGRATLELPPVLDIRQAGPLADQFKTQRGKPLMVDAGAVERLGGQCLQVLLAARNGWADDQKEFNFSSVSDALRHDLNTLGLELEALSYKPESAS